MALMVLFAIPINIVPIYRYQVEMLMSKTEKKTGENKLQNKTKHEKIKPSKSNESATTMRIASNILKENTYIPEILFSMIDFLLFFVIMHSLTKKRINFK